MWKENSEWEQEEDIGMSSIGYNTKEIIVENIKQKQNQIKIKSKK